MANFEIIDDRTELQLDRQEAVMVCSLLMAQLASTPLPRHQSGACPEIPLYLLEMRMAFISVADRGNQLIRDDKENTIFCLMDPSATATFIAGVLGIFAKSYQEFTLPEPFVQGGRSLTLTVKLS